MFSCSWLDSGVKNVEYPTDELNESVALSAFFLKLLILVRVVRVAGVGENREAFRFQLRVLY